MSQSHFLEIPKLDSRFPFRSFPDYGQVFVYPHWHKEVEFIYVVEGTIKIGVADQLLSLNAGDIYFFDSGVPHYFLASPESQRFVYQFDLSLFSTIFLDANYGETIDQIFTTRENWSVNWPEDVQNKCQKLLTQLMSHYENKAGNGLYEVYAMLHELLVVLHKEVPKKQGELRKIVSSVSLRDKETIGKMDQIFAYLESNYQHKISMEEIAKQIGFNPQYFSRFFKKQTGITFTEFLTEYRLNIAKAILSSETSSMIEVAEKSGFNSVKTFHHVFKEYVGMSPKKYRMSISGN